MLSRPFLKTLATKAHSLRPIVIIGGKGLTEKVHHEIHASLLAHELVKIRVNATTREERQAMIDEIISQHESALVQQIGHILVIYRKNPD
ncbi:MAG TPA: YhbY family RNA-binding protein [Candidatus Berkiella sp.]|nr:YhbY family RNA-binding protein [Candidatus Berkiella sp.]